MDVKNLLLGLDLGTSSIKLILYNFHSNKIELDISRSTTKARIVYSDNPLFDEQNVDVLYDLIKEMFTTISEDLWYRLRAVRLCGQMHGVLLWNTKTIKHSNLVTWQDARCSKEFLDSLPIKSEHGLNSGYGCATLFWYALNNQNEFLNQFDSCGTIHDYISYLLCGKTLMSDQNAYSWGYFDEVQMKWQENLITCEIFPCKLLPKVVNSNTIQSDIITLLHNGQKLDHTNLYVSIGDMQACVYSCLESENDCVINISTSSQICIAIDKSQLNFLRPNLPKSIIVTPFFRDNALLVGASLNGGNVLEKFLQMIKSWNKDLDLDDDSSTNLMWQKIIDLGLKFSEKSEKSTVEFHPTLFGERHDLKNFASLSNITHTNCSLGELFTSICNGLVKNLHQMITDEILSKIKRLVCTGSALIRNKVLQKQIEIEFKMFPIVYKAASDAALGACLSLI